MGFGKNIKNLFVTRSFVRREIGNNIEYIRNDIEQKTSQVEESLTKKITKKIEVENEATKSHLDTLIRAKVLSLMELSGVHLYLQKYYGKVLGKDYKTHYVSYYYATYGYTNNLGDYIQTIATEEAIKKCVKGPVVFENVLRSALTDHQGGTCVMQGWYVHKQLTFLPGPDTRPVWVGTHFCADARVMIESLFVKLCKGSRADNEYGKRLSILEEHSRDIENMLHVTNSGKYTIT